MDEAGVDSVFVADVRATGGAQNARSRAAQSVAAAGARRRARSAFGFSLVEVLLTVAILIILMSIAVPALTSLINNLHQTELDAKAETIYVAAQEQMSQMRSNGTASRLTPGKTGVEQFDESSDICYVTSTSADGAIATLLFGDGADSTLDDELRNGNWVIEYNYTSLEVKAVYYSAASYTTLLNKYGSDEAWRNNIANSKSYRISDGIHVGYYCGDTDDANAKNKSVTLTATHINSDELTATFVLTDKGGKFASASASEMPVIKVELQDTAGNTYTTEYSFSFVLAGASTSSGNATLSVNTSKTEYKVVVTLDSLASNGARFATLYGADAPALLASSGNTDLLSGTTINVTATLETKSVSCNTAKDSFNSLFDDSSTDAIMATGGIAATDGTAVITNARHLQNLDKSSGVNLAVGTNKSNVTTAKIASDLAMGSGSTWASTYGSSYFNGTTTVNDIALPNFQPIANDVLTNVDGQGKAIGGLATDASSATNYTGADAGLFGETANGTTARTVTLANIKLADTTAKAKASGNAGSLVGNVSASDDTLRILNCQSYLTSGSIVTNDLAASAKKAQLTGANVGGLVGAITSGTVKIGDATLTAIEPAGSTGSSASVIAGDASSTNVGGLVGSVGASGKLYIYKSYADCYLTGANVGGLVGGGTVANIADSYVAGFAKATTSAAGLVDGTLSAVANSYTILNTLNSVDSTYTDAVAKYYTLSQNKLESVTGVYYGLPSKGITTRADVDYGQKISSDISGANLPLGSDNGFTKTEAIYSVPYSIALDLSKTTYAWPTISGLYNYGDWFYQSDHTVKFELNAADATVTYAKTGWENYYDTQSVEDGKTAIDPVASGYIEVSRSGYIFGGWYYYTDGGKSTADWDFKTPVTDDITLYAKWIQASRVGYFEFGGKSSAYTLYGQYAYTVDAAIASSVTDTLVDDPKEAASTISYAGYGALVEATTTTDWRTTLPASRGAQYKDPVDVTYTNASGTVTKYKYYELASTNASSVTVDIFGGATSTIFVNQNFAAAVNKNATANNVKSVFEVRTAAQMQRIGVPYDVTSTAFGATAEAATYLSGMKFNQTHNINLDATWTPIGKIGDLSSPNAQAFTSTYNGMTSNKAYTTTLGTNFKFGCGAVSSDSLFDDGNGGNWIYYEGLFAAVGKGGSVNDLALKVAAGEASGTSRLVTISASEKSTCYGLVAGAVLAGGTLQSNSVAFDGGAALTLTAGVASGAYYECLGVFAGANLGTIDGSNLTFNTGASLNVTGGASDSSASNASMVGGFVGYDAKNNDATGVTTSSTISSASATSGSMTVNNDYGIGNAYAGGLVGYEADSISGVTLDLRSVALTVKAENATSEAYAGGVVGYVDSNLAYAGVGTNSNNAMNATVEARAKGATYAGGTAGYVKGTASYSYNYFNSSTDADALTVNAESSGDVSYAGGVAGAVNGMFSKSSITVGIKLHVASTTTANNMSFSGGLVGRTLAGASSSAVVVYDCAIQSTSGDEASKTGGDADAGGAIGRSDADVSSVRMTINGTSTSNEVSSISYGKAWTSAGGVVGRMDSGEFTGVNTPSSNDLAVLYNAHLDLRSEAANEVAKDCQAYTGGIVGLAKGGVSNLVATVNGTLTSTATTHCDKDESGNRYDADAGGLIGNVTGDVSSIVLNDYGTVEVDAVNSGSDRTSAGGVIGCAVSSSQAIDSVTCTVGKSSVLTVGSTVPVGSGEVRNGGVIGFAANTDGAKSVSNITATGTFKVGAQTAAASTGTIYNGGMIGSLDGAAKHLVSNGTYTVKALSSSATRTLCAGGLVGFANGPLGAANATDAGGNVTDNSVTAEGSYDVEAADETAASGDGEAYASAGGIVGYASAQGALQNATMTVTSSLNVVANDANKSFAGGVVGRTLGLMSDVSAIAEEGELDVEATSASDCAISGGLVGFASADVSDAHVSAEGVAKVNATSSEGDAYAAMLVANLTGSLDAGATTSSSVALTNAQADVGAIATTEGKTSAVGGIVGYSKDATIINPTITVTTDNSDNTVSKKSDLETSVLNLGSDANTPTYVGAAVGYHTGGTVTLEGTGATLESGTVRVLRDTTLDSGDIKDLASYRNEQINLYQAGDNAKYLCSGDDSAMGTTTHNTLAAGVDTGRINAYLSGLVDITHKDFKSGNAVGYKQMYPRMWNVTFDGNGSQTAPTDPAENQYEIVDNGSKISEPTATSSPVVQPTRAGYKFAGWYKEQACTNEWDFDTDIVTSDTTLYAKWTPIVYAGYFEFTAKSGTGSEAYDLYGWSRYEVDGDSHSSLPKQEYLVQDDSKPASNIVDTGDTGYGVMIPLDALSAWWDLQATHSAYQGQYKKDAAGTGPAYIIIKDNEIGITYAYIPVANAGAENWSVAIGSGTGDRYTFHVNQNFAAAVSNPNTYSGTEFQIRTANQMQHIGTPFSDTGVMTSDDTYLGSSSTHYTFKQTHNIEIGAASGYEGWTPIGIYTNSSGYLAAGPFWGIFNGATANTEGVTQNYSISLGANFKFKTCAYTTSNLSFEDGFSESGSARRWENFEGLFAGLGTGLKSSSEIYTGNSEINNVRLVINSDFNNDVFTATGVGEGKSTNGTGSAFGLLVGAMVNGAKMSGVSVEVGEGVTANLEAPSITTKRSFSIGSVVGAIQGGTITGSSFTIGNGATLTVDASGAKAEDAKLAGGLVGCVPANYTYQSPTLSCTVDAPTFSGSGTLAVISDNTSNSSVACKTFAGGITGYAIDRSVVSLNWADIDLGGITLNVASTSTLTANAYAGGLIGLHGSDISGATATLEATLTSTGGMATISAESDSGKAYSGGIAGNVCSTVTASSLKVTLQNEAQWTVSADTASGTGYMGGVVGYAAGTLTTPQLIVQRTVDPTSAMKLTKLDVSSTSTLSNIKSGAIVGYHAGTVTLGEYSSTTPTDASVQVICTGKTNDQAWDRKEQVNVKGAFDANVICGNDDHNAVTGGPSDNTGSRNTYLYGLADWSSTSSTQLYPLTYFVTWNGNGGAWTEGETTVSTKYTYVAPSASGSLIEEIDPSPTRSGSSLVEGKHWYYYTDDAKTHRAYWDFSSDKVTDNVTLYANWLSQLTLQNGNDTLKVLSDDDLVAYEWVLPETNKYTKYFEAFSEGATEYEYSEKLANSETLKGFYTANDGTGTLVLGKSGAIDSGATNVTDYTSDGKFDVNGSQKLYANWKTASGDTTFDKYCYLTLKDSLDDSATTVWNEFVPENASKITNIGDFKNYTKPSRSGTAVLIGWYTKDSIREGGYGEKVLDADGNIVEGAELNWDENNEITLYAKWAYYLTLKNGKNTQLASEGVVNGTTEYPSYPVRLYNSRTLVQFDGTWGQTQEVLSNKGIAVGTVSNFTKDGTFDLNESMTAYARWKTEDGSTTNSEYYYLILRDERLSQEGGTTEFDYWSDYVPNSWSDLTTLDYSKPETDPEDLGRTLEGWYTKDADGNFETKIYTADGSLVSTLPVVSGQDTILYAKWVGNFTLTLKNKNTTIFSKTITNGTLDTYPGYTLVQPSTLKTLDGWYIKSDGKYGQKILDKNGEVASGAESVDGYTKDGKLYLTDNQTLYAKWTASKDYYVLMGKDSDGNLELLEAGGSYILTNSGTSGTATAIYDKDGKGNILDVTTLTINDVDSSHMDRVYIEVEDYVPGEESSKTPWACLVWNAQTGNDSGYFYLTNGQYSNRYLLCGSWITDDSTYNWSVVLGSFDSKNVNKFEWKVSSQNHLENLYGSKTLKTVLVSKGYYKYAYFNSKSSYHLYLGASSGATTNLYIYKKVSGTSGDEPMLILDYQSEKAYEVYAEMNGSNTLTDRGYVAPDASLSLQGWYTDPTGGTKVLNADGSVYEDAEDVENYTADGKLSVTGTQTLYAHYGEYYLSLKNGDTVVMEPTKVSGAKLDYDKSWIPGGATLEGWYAQNSDGTYSKVLDADGNVVADVEGYTSGGQFALTSNRTLHAGWQKSACVLLKSTETFEDGGKYVLASSGSAGSAYAVEATGTSSTSFGTQSITVKKGSYYTTTGTAVGYILDPVPSETDSLIWVASNATGHESEYSWYHLKNAQYGVYLGRTNVKKFYDTYIYDKLPTDEGNLRFVSWAIPGSKYQLKVDLKSYSGSTYWKKYAQFSGSSFEFAHPNYESSAHVYVYKLETVVTFDEQK